MRRVVVATLSKKASERAPLLRVVRKERDEGRGVWTKVWSDEYNGGVGGGWGFP